MIGCYLVLHTCSSVFTHLHKLLRLSRDCIFFIRHLTLNNVLYNVLIPNFRVKTYSLVNSEYLIVHPNKKSNIVIPRWRHFCEIIVSLNHKIIWIKSVKKRMQNIITFVIIFSSSCFYDSQQNISCKLKSISIEQETNNVTMTSNLLFHNLQIILFQDYHII